jgi:hypothetical protein
VASGRRRSTSFSLVTPPTPIPDDPDEEEAGRSTPSEPVQPSQPAPDAATPEPKAAAASEVNELAPDAVEQDISPTSAVQPPPTPTRERGRGERKAAEVPAPAPPPGRKAAAVVRLHQPVAEALYEAFLDERRRVDPRVSYPAFASRIVSAGLAAERRRRSSP